MFRKRQAQELRFMTQQKLHSVRSTGTATAILMSPDPPVLRAKVWLARLLQALSSTLALLGMLQPRAFGSLKMRRDLGLSL